MASRYDARVEEIAVGLAAIVLLGAAAQWLGWRLHIPSILLLLLVGFLGGPEVAGLVRPDEMFGDLLLPGISLSVAILLFEGALTLRWRELGEYRGVVGRLIHSLSERASRPFVITNCAAIPATLLESDDRECDGFILVARVFDPINGAEINVEEWSDLCQDPVERVYESMRTLGSAQCT